MDALELQAALVKLDPATTVTPIVNANQLSFNTDEVDNSIGMKQQEVVVQVLNTPKKSSSSTLSSSTITTTTTTTTTSTTSGSSSTTVTLTCGGTCTALPAAIRKNSKSTASQTTASALKCNDIAARWRQPCTGGVNVIYHTYPPHRTGKHHKNMMAKERRHHHLHHHYHHHTLHHHKRDRAVSYNFKYLFIPCCTRCGAVRCGGFIFWRCTIGSFQWKLRKKIIIALSITFILWFSIFKIASVIKTRKERLRSWYTQKEWFEKCSTSNLYPLNSNNFIEKKNFTLLFITQTLNPDLNIEKL